MRKVPLSGTLLILIGLGMIVGLGAYLWKGLGPKPPVPPPTIVGWPPQLLESTMTTTPDPQSTPQPLPSELSLYFETTVLPKSTPTLAPPWTFDGIDFNSHKKISIFFELVEDEGYLLAPFTSHAWARDTWWEHIFDPASEGHHGVVWKDSNLRLGLWLHSGDGEIMFPLQEKLERDSRGYFYDFRDAQTYLQEHVYGARVVIRQNNVISIGRVKSVVRVGSQAVLELQPHVMDLIDWLAKWYAGVHFEDLVEESNVLMIYFCGRLLNGETKNPDLTYWQQARFIIAIMPEGD